VDAALLAWVQHGIVTWAELAFEGAGRRAEIAVMWTPTLADGRESD
jgi:hypothetical protein